MINDTVNEMLVSLDRDCSFTSNEFVMMIRQRLANKPFTVPIFMKFCRWLCSQFSHKSYHKMAKYALSSASYKNSEKIKGMFDDVKIDQDVLAGICIQVILEPLGLLID